MVTTPGQLPNGQVGVAYRQELTGSGGRPPYRWDNLLGNPPDGVNFNVNGFLAGTPLSAGTWTLNARVTDTIGNTATKNLSVTITGTPLFIVTDNALPGGRVGVAYRVDFVASGGAGPYRWDNLQGNPPDGVNFNVNGFLIGTPLTVGSWTIRARVTDSVGATAVKDLTVNISH